MSRHGSRTRAVALAVAAMTVATLMPTPASAAPGLTPAGLAGLAPAFTLELLNGKTLSLADYKGAPVILLFWAPW